MKDVLSVSSDAVTEAGVFISPSHARRRVALMVSLSSATLLAALWVTEKNTPTHDVERRINDAIAARVEAAISLLGEEDMIDREDLEQQAAIDIAQLRKTLEQAIPECCDQYETSDSSILAAVFMDTPLTSEKLYEASKKLSPSMRNQLSTIAEVLTQCPELAPDVLMILHHHLENCRDYRFALRYLVPKTHSSLSDRDFVFTTATGYLQLHDEAGGIQTQRKNNLAQAE